MKIPRNTMQAGYTLIETFVAITVLMIAVASPLVVAQRGIDAALYARDQTLAYYLAQDGVEYIRKIRDSELLGGTASIWNGVINQCKNNECGLANTRSYTMSISNNCFELMMYLDETKPTDPGNYTYELRCEAEDEYYHYTGFTRSFTITDIQTANDRKEVVLNMKVTWPDGEVNVSEILYEIAPY